MGDEDKIALKVVKIANAARGGLSAGVRSVPAEKMLQLREKALRENRNLAEVFNEDIKPHSVKTVTARELKAIKIQADKDGVSLGKAVRAAVNLGEAIDTSAIEEKAETPQAAPEKVEPFVEEVVEEPVAETVEEKPARGKIDIPMEEEAEDELEEEPAEEKEDAPKDDAVSQFKEYAITRTIPEIRKFSRVNKIPISSVRKADIVDELAIDIPKKLGSYDEFYAAYPKP